MTARQRARLLKLLLKGAAAHGFSTDLWTLSRVAQVITRTFGVTYHPAHVWYGWYSNVCRDKRRKAQAGTPSGAPAELTVVPVTPANREWRASSKRCTRWTRSCAPYAGGGRGDADHRLHPAA